MRHTRTPKFQLSGPTVHSLHRGLVTCAGGGLIMSDSNPIPPTPGFGGYPGPDGAAGG